MAKVRVELCREGVRELLRSEEMLSVCREHAERAAERCGRGYEVNTHVGRNRVNAEVRAVTWEAWRDNLRNNTILKALK